MRRIKKRSAAVGLLTTGLLTIGMGAALEGTASADPHFEEENFDLHLKDDHHDDSWADHVGKEDECEGHEELTPEGFDYLWHFVVPSYPVGGTPDVTAVYAYFSTAGEVSGGHVVQSGKGWNLYTATADTLVDAVGDSSATEDVPVEMNLSHTCGPTTSSSSSSSSESSSSESSSSESSSSESSSSESSSSSTSESSSSESSSSESSSSSTSESSSSDSSSSESSVLSSSIESSADSSSAASSESSSPEVGGVVVEPESLPATGFDPGFLLMIGGLLVLSGVLMLRYSPDRG